MTVDFILFASSNLISFALGGGIVYYLFIRNEKARIKGLRHYFRKKIEEDNGNGTSTSPNSQATCGDNV